jgi:Undecaprenyl-phosphate glucose phosphotransferase
MQRNYNKILTAIYFIIDLIIIIIAYSIAHALRFEKVNYNNYDLLLLIFSILVWIVLSRITNYYKIKNKGLFKRTIDIIIISALFFLSVSMFAFFFKVGDFSRLMFMYYTLSLIVLLFISHVFLLELVKRIIPKNPSKNLLIIGAGRIANDITEEVRLHPESGLKIIGYLDDKPKGKQNKDRVVGKLYEYETVIKQNNIDEVIIALPLSYESLIIELIDRIEPMGVRLLIVPDFYRVTKRSFRLEKFGNTPILTIRNIPLDNIVSRLIKRLFDIAFSLIILIIFSPIYIAIAIIIKLSSKGPVHFIQKRTGYNQKDFKCIKFRSMKVTSKEIADKIQCKEDDPRKTQLGEFLRKTNIDEIPQFVNVLKGDMSIVGPRPHMLAHTEEFRERVGNYMLRHFVKPGITGWAQVNGWRGPTDEDYKIKKRVEYDLWYVENWTFWLDVKIIFMTVFSKKSKLNAF